MRLTLRRVILEVPRRCLSQEEGAERVDTLGIIQMLRSDANFYSGICRVRPRGRRSLEELVGAFGITRIEPLSKEKDGSCIAYIEGRPMSHWIRTGSARDAYQSPPFELTPTAWRKTLIGSEAQIRRSIKKLEMAGLKFKIAWSGDADFGPGSLISTLTQGQRKVLSVAHEIGYFDFPRRAGSDKLAETVGLSKSTVSEHLRRAEKSVLDGLFNSQGA